MIAVEERAPLAVGDLVVLRSGGPSLTVVAVDIDVITCTWFNGTEMCEAHLPRACIDRIATRAIA